jgi:hypothetical protein
MESLPHWFRYNRPLSLLLQNISDQDGESAYEDTDTEEETGLTSTACPTMQSATVAVAAAATAAVASDNRGVDGVGVGRGTPSAPAAQCRDPCGLPLPLPEDVSEDVSEGGGAGHEADEVAQGMWDILTGAELDAGVFGDFSFSSVPIDYELEE